MARVDKTVFPAIITPDGLNDWDVARHFGAFPIRICSPQKTTVARGEPGALYSSPMIKTFVRKIVGATCTRDYAILSRRHGIMVGWEQYDQYTDDQQLDDDALLELLKKQRLETWLNPLVYWNHRPLTHDKWVRMLRDAGFYVLEARTLDEVYELSVGRVPKRTKHHVAVPAKRNAVSLMDFLR